MHISRFVIYTLYKLSYLGIKRILDKDKVDYSCVTIVQKFNIKESIEELEIKSDRLTIASVDAVNVYPSIQLATIKKAVGFFRRGITGSTKKTIDLCLELILFGIRFTLISSNGIIMNIIAARSKN